MTIRAILTDIEGTTSSISFVKDVLFPYAREHMAAFINAHADEPDVRAALDDVAREVGQVLDDEAAVAQLLRWIDEDRKITPLKALQGMIWEAGYRNGDFHGHMYPDAVDGLRRWHDAGVKLYVYSSGSVYAQKLLFGHTPFGDLTPLFSDYFDTRIGAKVDSASYRAISEQIGLPASQILFLSDITAELDAAQAAGLRTTQLLREPGMAGSAHPSADTFDDIRLD
ncbi:MAG: acireductone synthase [Gammaproteobacteria bacterium]|nr:acireductone synthase [Gammaproteobacteria bacterium]